MATIPFLSSLVVPAGTALTAPVQQVLRVAVGRVVLLRLYVPDGPRREVYLRLKHGTALLAPYNPERWWRPDGVVLDFPLDYVVPPGERDFVLEGASPEANFSHDVDFELQVDTSEAPALPAQPGSLGERILSLLGG